VIKESLVLLQAVTDLISMCFEVFMQNQSHDLALF